MIKCEKCGKEIDSVLVNMFNVDGSDRLYSEPIVYNGKRIVYFETGQCWTGYELSDEERLETICCPHCKEYPFKNSEIEVYDVVRVFCFPQEEKKCED